MDQQIETRLREKQLINNATYRMKGTLGVMCLPHTQLVHLLKLSKTIRFSNDYNTRWRLLNLSNNNFMIYPNASKTPLDSGKKSHHSMPFTLSFDTS